MVGSHRTMTAQKITPVIGARRLLNSKIMYVIDDGDIDDIVNKYMKCSICATAYNVADSNITIGQRAADTRGDIFAIGVKVKSDSVDSGSSPKKIILEPRDITVIYRILK